MSSRKITGPKKLCELWQEYKSYCDNREILVHDFSQKQSVFVSAKLKKRISYTIEGFCVFIGLARSSFYANYADNPKFTDIVKRIKEECEVDAREKFETGEIPSQLAGLWMSKHGYTTKQDNTVTGAIPIVISGEENLAD